MRRAAHNALVTMATGSLLMAATLPSVAQGTARARRYDRVEVGRLIRQLQDESTEFRRVMDRELDRSRLNETRAENRIFNHVRDLDRAIDRLHSRFDRTDRRRDTRDELQDVRRKAVDMDGIMARRRLNGRMEGAWFSLRSDLNRLLRMYDLPLINEVAGRVPFGRRRRY